MKTYKEYISEAIGIQDGSLVFDYNRDPNGEEISSRFGKKYKGTKFEPFTSTPASEGRYKVYSAYTAKGTSKSDIFKAIKRQSKITIQDEGYYNFVKRTAIWIDAKIVKPNKIDIIVLPSSSSFLNEDVVLELHKKNPTFQYITKAFTKADVSDIKIDINHPKITPSIIKKLEKVLDKAKKDGYFQMKEIGYGRDRVFIKDFLNISIDRTMLNHFEGKNILVFDDIYSTGSTQVAMFKHLEMYMPAKIMGVTLFKTGK